jgi:nucleotide-binding universal stress UspA family protein
MDRYEWGVGTVICGVDGSSRALLAATAAADLANALDTTLTLACVDDPWTRDLGSARSGDVVRAAAEAVDPLTRVDEVTAVGNAARQLTRLARERDASLIAVGSRGRGPAQGRALGSITAIVTGLAECPVLIVPPRVEARVASNAAVGRRLWGTGP